MGRACIVMQQGREECARSHARLCTALLCHSLLTLNSTLGSPKVGGKGHSEVAIPTVQLQEVTLAASGCLHCPLQHVSAHRPVRLRERSLQLPAWRSSMRSMDQLACCLMSTMPLSAAEQLRHLR